MRPICPGVGEDPLIFRKEQVELSIHKYRMCLSETDQLLIEVIYGIGIFPFFLRIDLRIIRIDRDPRRSGCETGTRSCTPLHGRTGVVAASGVDGPHDIFFFISTFQPFAVQVQRLDVFVITDVRESHIGHTQFFALVHIGRSLHAVKDHRQHLRGFHAVLPVISPPGYDAGQVVVIPEQAVPSFAVQFVLPFCQTFLQTNKGERRQIPLFFPFLLVHDHMLELEYHGEFTAVRIAVEFCDLGSRAPCLAHRDQIALLECFPAQLLQEFMEPGPVVRDHPVRLLGDLVDHIQPESAHAFIHPPEDHVVDLPAHLRILPVEIRLLHRELMEIILVYFRHPLPGRSAEGGFHFIGILVLHAIPPHIIIMVRIIF